MLFPVRSSRWPRSSLGANKLRPRPTMLGHHHRRLLGDFSHDRVSAHCNTRLRTALAFSAPTSFSLPNIRPMSARAATRRKNFATGSNITYKQALHYYRLMEGEAREICLEKFWLRSEGQAVYNGIKTTPSLLIVGTNQSFLTANAHTLGYGRNLNDEDVDLHGA